MIWKVNRDDYLNEYLWRLLKSMNCMHALQQYIIMNKPIKIIAPPLLTAKYSSTGSEELHFCVAFFGQRAVKEIMAQ